MLVVADTDDVFIPLLDGFFVKPSEAQSMLQRFGLHCALNGISKVGK